MARAASDLLRRLRRRRLPPIYCRRETFYGLGQHDHYQGLGSMNAKSEPAGRNWLYPAGRRRVTSCRSAEDELPAGVAASVGDVTHSHEPGWWRGHRPRWSEAVTSQGHGVTQLALLRNQYIMTLNDQWLV